MAILVNASNIDTLLNNLSEADFDLESISVLMNDTDQRNNIAKDTGPLKGVGPKNIIEALTKAGVPKKSAEDCHQAVAKGKVLLVMNVADEYSQAAEEIFQDHSAQLVKGITHE